MDLEQPFVVPARFNGPPQSANGGWVGGHAAARLRDAVAVSVRLLSPPPLDTRLHVEADGPGLLVRADDRPVLRATPVEALTDEVVPPVEFEVAEASGAAYEGLERHPFPTCYSCGTQREDGLALRPGRVAGGEGEYAAAWVAREVSTETVWAVLDCPGGWSAGIAGRPMVLGTMSAQVDALPPEDEECVVMAWSRGGDGRKYHSGTALYAADGLLLARAEALWIAVDPTAFSPGGG